MTNGEGVAIIVEMKTHINDGSNEETNCLSTEGRFFKKSETIYLQFPEENQSGSINQVVKINNQKEVTVIRQGAVSMKQNFLEGDKSEGVYRSQFGIMLMETTTKKIDIKIDEKQQSGTISICYDLHMQHEFAGNYAVTINFRRNIDEYC